MGPALREGCGRRRHQRKRLLPRGQPQQALGHARYRAARGPGDRQAPDREERHLRREFQGRRHGALQPRLRADQIRLPAPHLLLDHRVRPDRALCAARRLRFPGPGHGRHHVGDGRSLDPAAEGRRGGHGYHLRHLFRGRHPGRVAAPSLDRSRAAGRSRPAGHAGELARQYRPAVPYLRQGAAAPGQRASQHRAVLSRALLRRLFHPRDRQ